MSCLGGVIHRSQAAATSPLQLHTRTRSKLKKAFHKVTEERRGVGGRLGDFFFKNASGLHCRESPHKRMGSCRQASGLRLSLAVPPLPPSSHAHTHKLKPPDRKYRLGSQRGILIQTSPVEQPEVAAPTSLFLSLPLRSLSF